MPEERRVIVIKRRRFPLWSDSGNAMKKGERKSKADSLRGEGREFFTFCWDLARFKEFVARCEVSGTRPNAALWTLICKEMGWIE